MNYLFSDSFERVASQLCLILLVSIVLDKKPHYRRLLIWEGLYGLSILLIPALRQHVVCLYEQRFLVLESIPLIAWIFCVSHCGHLLFAALPINAIMALFRTIVYVLVSPVYFLPVFNLGVTFDEILSLGQVLLVLMTFFLLKRVRFPFNTLYQNIALRLSIGSASLFVLLFYLWLRPLDPDYTEKSIWLSFSIITIILLTIFLIGVAFLVKKQKAIHQLKQRIQDLEEEQALSAEYIHETRRAVSYLKELNNSCVGQEILKDDFFSSLTNLPDTMKRIVISYLPLLEQAQIDFQLAATPSLNEWPLSEKEMLSILGNLFDNAIEEMAASPPDKRWLRMTVLEEDPWHTLILENPYNARLLPTENLTQQGITSKSASHFGIGLPIVNRLVRKKGGILQLSPRENTFLVRVDIPLNP